MKQVEILNAMTLRENRNQNNDTKFLETSWVPLLSVWKKALKNYDLKMRL